MGREGRERQGREGVRAWREMDEVCGGWREGTSFGSNNTYIMPLHFCFATPRARLQKNDALSLGTSVSNGLAKQFEGNAARDSLQ